MNIRTQELDIAGKKMVVLPKSSWRKVLEDLEELDDIRALDAALAHKKACPNEKTYTLDEVWAQNAVKEFGKKKNVVFHDYEEAMAGRAMRKAKQG